MTAALADARFLLPSPPRSATVGAGAEAWLPVLERAGIETTAGRPADLLVSGAELAVEESAGIPSVIFDGRGRLDGYTNRRYVVFGSRVRPGLFVPRDRRNVTSYALSAWSSPRTRLRALRRQLVLRLPRAALLLARWPEVTIATRDASPPYLVEAALKLLGEDGAVDWLLVCGQSDDLGRAAFLLFPESSTRPRWIVKFVRVPSYTDPIDRDERALAAVAAVGGAAAAHAPRFLGRFEVNGLAASVETAATGRRLSAVLGSAVSSTAKRRLVDAVAGWIVRVGVETRQEGAAAELERLRSDVLPSWPDASGDLLGDLAGVPAVLQHNDLGPWNIVSAGDEDFTAVDWESANPSGLPLWDLWYFLAHALLRLDREGGDGGGAFARLFRGETAGSAELFRWTRVAVDSLGVRPETVGRLATLCWLHHGLSHQARGATVDRLAPGGDTLAPAAAEYPRIWLSDPALGPGWRRWMDS